MDLTHALKLAKKLDELQSWQSEKIMVELQLGADGVSQEVNLVTVTQQIPLSKGRRKFMEDKKNRYYLPASINSNNEATRRNQVVPFMAQACAKVGIEIRSRGWQDGPQKLTLKCIRGRVYSSQQSKQNSTIQQSRQGNGENGSAAMIHPKTGYRYSKPFQQRNSKTERPKEGESLCPFQIVLKWEPDELLETGRWYIFHCNNTHHGHHRKEADDVRLYLRHRVL